MKRRTRYVLVLVLAAVLVNLPLLHATWTDLRVDRSGVEVGATVVDHRTAGEQHLLTFRFPEDIDPDQRTWSADVDAATFDRAVGTGEITVRVVESDPAAYRVDGQVDSSALLVITLIADVLLVVVALLLWRYGGRRRPQLRAIAVGDVERCPPGVALDRIEGETYLVRGEVAELGDDRVVIELADRSVLVLLDGHRNPVGHQQAAQVHARLI
ncbi:hypothetical protein KM427_01300 [Nocardioides sp. LMS-CY]|uniref:hypothetical protein n=1 Tax=Nocardioides sp. (strain LMS-CY) TaxID=2840457 RepID=UPI001BFFF2A1|nr:hypothetical protein [Nocardioides sp. LMS-CY]QWF22418.1 hypothetical protein KM427_01300 [Nocardioides sp. LMS-CY]